MILRRVISQKSGRQTVWDGVVLVGISCLCLSLSSLAYAQQNNAFPKLKQSMSLALADKQLQKTTVGIYAVDVKTGQVLYSRLANKPMNPASNMKLFTAAAALDKLGAQKTWETIVMTRRKDKGVLKELMVKASGDPLLSADHMLGWAYTLKQLGVKRIDGDLVVDISAFDDKTIPPGFDQKPEDASYRAPIGAFSVNFNASHVHITPGENGKPARVRLVPDNDHIKIVNEATTVAGKRASVRVKSITSGKGTVMKVTGKIGVNANEVVWRKRIDAPALHAGAVLVKRLKAMGIAFKGKIRLGKVSSAVALIRHQSSPLTRAIWVMNKWSNNFIAEQLLKHLGAQADAASTSEQGKQAITAFLKKYKIDTKGMKLLNGSGLYTGNWVTPKQIVDLLRVMHKHPRRAEFVASLPIAGVDGTLSRRMTKGQAHKNLRGKTGTLNQVSALSGYLTTASGRTVAYSIILNDPPTYAWRLRKQQDQLAEVLASSKE